MTNLLLSIYALWFISEVLLARFLRSKGSDQKNKDKKSLLAIWLTIIISITGAILLTYYVQAPLSMTPFAHIFGGVLVVAGIILRMSVIYSLGAFFTVDVTIRNNHKLKVDGYYKYLRHPSYFASLISFVGFGISLNNWFSLGLVVSAITGAFIFRIRVEEDALIGQFGDQYLNYRNTTRGLIPFVY